MADRVTAKSNIATINVPSVTNAELNTILQNEICDNVVFKEDTAVAQVSSVSTIALDFTAKDRINLTRTGGSLAISVSGIADGQTVYVLITKTAGQAITFSGVTDITPNIPKVTELATVLYQIIRKGANYFAIAFVKTIISATETNEGILSIATAAECNALSSTTKIVTPGRIPTAQLSQAGVIALATQYEANQMTASNKAIVPSTIPQAADDQKGVIQIATAAECNGFSVSNKAVVPTRIPIATTTQKGVAKFATSAQIDAGTDSDQGGSLVVIPSELKRKYDAAIIYAGTKVRYFGLFHGSTDNSFVRYKGDCTLTIKSDEGDGHWKFNVHNDVSGDDWLYFTYIVIYKNHYCTNSYYISSQDSQNEFELRFSQDADVDVLILQLL